MKADKTPKLLRQSMAKAGETQVTLASAMGITQPYVSRVLSGKHVPSAEWLNLVAKAMNLTDEERRNLHRAAAQDQGYEIDLS